MSTTISFASPLHNCGKLYLAFLDPFYKRLIIFGDAKRRFLRLLPVTNDGSERGLIGLR